MGKGQGPRKMLKVQVGWLIVERGWGTIKVLRGCCKFKWRKMNEMGRLWVTRVKGSGD